MSMQTYDRRRDVKASEPEQSARSLRGMAARIGNQAMEGLLSGGAPSPEMLGRRVDLPGAIQEKMESAFGVDFSSVKLYESQAVADAGAKAVTMGGKIGFAPGALDFVSPSGQALLGHEFSHVASQARREVAGAGLVNDHVLEARADREGLMAASGEAVYSGPVTPFSGSSALPAAGPMQAKKDKKKAAESLDHMQSDGRSREVDEYFAGRTGDAQNRGELKDAHQFRLFSRQSYGKSKEEKDALYDLYTNSARKDEYLDHVRGLTDQTMKMDMDSFNLKDKKSLLRGAGRLSDVTTDVMALSDVIKDNQKALGYSDSFVAEGFGARRQFLMASKTDARGRLREMTGEAGKGSTVKSAYNTTAFGESGVNPGFAGFKERYVQSNRTEALKQAAASYNPRAMAQYKNMTPEQRKAGKDYVADSRDINGMLRGANVAQNKKAELETMSKNLSDAMQPLEKDEKGYRTISDAGLLPLLEQAGLGGVIKQNGTIDHQALMKQKDKLVGLSFQDKGFVSTTTSGQFADKWGANLGKRDLNYFKQRAVERRGITPEDRKDPHVADLLELVEGEQSKSMPIRDRQRVYGAVADNLLKGDQAINESDIGSHVMEIALPKGSKGTYIDAASTPSGELNDKTMASQQLEILLNKGSNFRISDIVQKMDDEGNALPNQYRIIMELLEEEKAKPEATKPQATTTPTLPQKGGASGFRQKLAFFQNLQKKK